MSPDVKYEFNSEDYPVNFSKDFTENISAGDQVYITYTLDFGIYFLFLRLNFIITYKIIRITIWRNKN